MRLSPRFLIPITVLVALMAVLAVGLRKDPRLIPSPLMNKPAPAFRLAVLGAPDRQVSLNAFHGRPVVINFFASWCADCRVEHPLLIKLANSGVEIVGMDYKDAVVDARDWLTLQGNPYHPVLSDLAGLTAIDWGVYGVPETFVVDARGTIVYKQVGALTPEIWSTQIAPLLGRPAAASTQ